MNSGVLSNPVLDFKIDLKFFLFLFPVFFTFDLIYYFSFYAVFVFIIFFVDKLNSGFRDFYVHSFFYWVLLLVLGMYEVTVSFVKSEAFYYYYITVLIPFLLFLIFTNTDLKLKYLDKFFHILFISGIILSLYSISVLSSINFDFRYRITSLWNHYNLVAAYFMVLLLFNLSFIVNSKFSKKTILYLISLVFILLGLLMTQTRGIWLATIIAILYYILKRPKLLLPVSIVTAIVFILFYGIIMDRFFSVVNFGNDISSIGRLQAWIASVILIKDNLLLGYGFDSFRYLRDKVFAVYFVILPHPHNTYLTLTLELGLIGFILYISFFVKAFYYSIKMRRNSKDSSLNKYLDGIQLSFVGFLVAFMFEPYFTVLGAITFVLWILISLSFYFRFSSSKLV
ncbi:MAG: O-antigen ligase family protein [Bacteroidetes bacterium]|nr:O-antigen ligase family protein [Bacteroidota bacterium]